MVDISSMNKLSRDIYTILENTGLGKMSYHLLDKQIKDTGTNMKNVTLEYLPKITKKLEEVLPFFIGEESAVAIQKIKGLNVQ